MVKNRLILLFVLIFSLLDVASGRELDRKIENLISGQTYNLNKNFIDRIFSNRESFYVGDNLDMRKIVYELKNNGLLSLKFNNPSEFRLSFVSKAPPAYLIKSVNSTLSAMGYTYFIVTKADSSKGNTIVEYSMSTEHVVDPVIMLDELSKRGLYCNDITKESIHSWSYSLLHGNSNIPGVKNIERGVSINTKEISGEYWFGVTRKGEMAVYVPKSNKKWIPRIAVYDKNLSVIYVYAGKNTAEVARVDIPENARFVRITDNENPDNLKFGIRVDFR